MKMRAGKVKVGDQVMWFDSRLGWAPRGVVSVTKVRGGTVALELKCPGQPLIRWSGPLGVDIEMAP
jgi:hypothetical protein